MPESTLSYWHMRYAKDPHYTPLNSEWGQHLRIFTDAQEQELSARIRTKYIDQHMHFSNTDFVYEALEFWGEICARHENRTDRFECSNGFITDFKKRNGFSTGRQHMKRRPQVEDDDNSQWISRVRGELKGKDKRYVLNCDETAWYVYPNGILTWVLTGSEDVSVNITGNEKDCLIVLATVSASGEKYPLMFVAKGKTDRIEDTQLGNVGAHWRAHTESGWMRKETFELYLMQLSQLCGGHEIQLLLDVHASHRAAECKELAKVLGIHFIYIPPGFTDALQPCDRRVFGSLKATARALWCKRQRENPGAKRTKIDAVQDMLTAWQSLSEDTLEDAWDICTEGI